MNKKKSTVLRQAKRVANRMTKDARRCGEHVSMLDTSRLKKYFYLYKVTNDQKS